MRSVLSKHLPVLMGALALLVPQNSLAREVLLLSHQEAEEILNLTQNLKLDWGQNSSLQFDRYLLNSSRQAQNTISQWVQVPERLTPDSAGQAPSLQLGPSIPREEPFQPRNLPLLPLETGSEPDRYRVNPSATIITPSAYGKSWGSLSVGVGLQSRTRFTDEPDGVWGIGIGLGDARKWVGLDIGVTVTDFDTARDGTVSFKLHRQLPEELAVAVGVQNAIAFGDTDGGTSVYGVITKRFLLQNAVEKPFSQLYISAGVGTGQFRSQFEINNDIDSINVFGSVAVRASEPVMAIAEWTGQDLTIGLSVVPFRNIPLVITPAVTDITGNAGDGSRFIVGAGYLISF